MLNDKRLAAAVLAAAKGGALKYRLRDERLDMIGEGWALMAYFEYVTGNLRKTLGTIVEMLGEIPWDCCVEIHKIKEEYIMQELEEAAFAEELGHLTSVSRPEICKPTCVSIGGEQLLQTQDGRCVSVKMGRLEMAYAASSPPAVVDEHSRRVQWNDQFWELTVLAYRPEEDPQEDRMAAIWAALEGMELTPWDRPEKPPARYNAPDQMDMLEAGGGHLLPERTNEN